MKKSNLLFIIFAAFTLLLVACGGNETTNEATEETIEVDTEEVGEVEELAFEPEDINEDVDVCEVCAMAVPDNEHATQIVLQNHRSLKFDDLGDLYKWKDENGEDEIGAEFVRDFHTEEWIQIKDATFVYDETISTPMAYGVISFKNKADAEKFIEEEEKGILLDVAALENHEWTRNKEMMMDMNHEHDDEHEHVEDNHDHEHDHEE